MSLYEKKGAGIALLEPTNKPIWDRKQVQVAAAQTLYFFKDFPAGYTKLTTNMHTASILGTPNEMYVYGLSCHIEQKTLTANKQRINDAAYIEFNVSRRVRTELPLYLIPDLGGQHGTTTESASNSLSNGIPGPLMYYPIGDEPIKINSSEIFHIKLEIAAVAVFTEAFYISFLLHGIFGEAR